MPKKSPAPMPRLPGNEAKTGADPRGPLPGGRDLLDFHGKKPGRGAYLAPVRTV